MLRRLSWSLMLVVATTCVVATNAAEPAGIEQQIQAQLRAGEFGPASELARKTDDPALSDRLLGNVAAAQAAAGARRASIETAGYISSDLTRGRTLNDLGARPIGVDRWRRGGGPVADFDPLINLITSTIAPESWDEVGGPGAIDGFAGGVYVDAVGTLRRIDASSGGRSLAALRDEAARVGGNENVRATSRLRKVSLTRLERQAQMLQALGRQPDAAMRALAGLYKIQYVLVYPETGDVVLAGPAGDWEVNAEGRQVNRETGKPVLQLDDFVVCLRNAYQSDSRFGCSITPRQKNLAETKAFLAETTLRGAAFREKLRETLGVQDIEVYGVDPQTRVARVMVEADYRMKQVGMGLEDGVLGVVSYLDSIKLGADDEPPATDVIRWWFTLNYDALRATEPRDAFELRGPGAKVLSENELLTERGERVHTGKSDGPTLEFAHSFTTQFDRLADKYPVYAELRNVFDLALVASLLKREDIPGQLDWHMTYFGPRQDNLLSYGVELAAGPKEVETIMNYRELRVAKGRGRSVTHTLVGVSGGVAVDPSRWTQHDAIQTDKYGLMKAERAASLPQDLARDAWWWD